MREVAVGSRVSEAGVLRYVAFMGLLALGLAGPTPALAQGERAQVEAAVRAYVAARNTADAGAVAALFSMQPGVTSISGGEIQRGWDQIRRHLSVLDSLTAAHQRSTLTVGSVDVTPLGLGVETVGRRMVTLVPRNTVLPVRARAIFTTVADNQKRARIAVLQGERSRAEEDILLGSFELQNIERGRKGSPDIEVCFQIDVNGFVHVSAEDLGTGSRRDIELEGAEHLDAQRIQSMIVEARAAELEDALAAG